MSVQPSARTFHKTVVHEARIGIWWRCGWLNRNSLCGVLKPLKELVPFYFFFSKWRTFLFLDKAIPFLILGGWVLSSQGLTLIYYQQIWIRPTSFLFDSCRLVTKSVVLEICPNHKVWTSHVSVSLFTKLLYTISGRSFRCLDACSPMLQWCSVIPRGRIPVSKSCVIFIGSWHLRTILRVWS